MARRPSSSRAFIVAVVAVLIALAIRVPLRPLIGTSVPYITFFAAVLIAAYYGGFLPGLLATVLGGFLALYVLVEPFHVLDLSDWENVIGLSRFLLAGVVISALFESLHRAERQAREGEARLLVTLASIGDAVLVTDAAGRVTFLNPIAEHLTGWPLVDASGHECSEVFRIVNEQTGKPADDPVARVLREGAVVGLEDHTVLIARDGTRRPIEDSAAPIRDATGSVGGVILVFRDVGKKRESDRFLAETQERFSRFMRHLPGLAWIKDADGRYVFANDAAERAFGIARAELYGKTDDELFPPATAAEFRENDQRARSVPSGTQAIETLKHPDGTVHYSLVSKFPIPSPAGQTTLVGGMAIDMTELRRAEETRAFLAEAGEILTSSLDSEETFTTLARLIAPRLADWCTISVVESDGRLRQAAVAHVDPAKVEWASELAHRYPPDSTAPHGVPRVVQTGEPELVPEITDEMLAAGARDAEHLAILRGLGLRSVMIVPLTARGRTLGAIAFVAAESGRRYGPDDLALAQDLGRRAGLAVDNARLLRESEDARRQAEHADQRKDEFLALLGHELRNPLAPISNAVQILELKARDIAAVNRAREVIGRQLTQLTRLVDELLDASRIARGKVLLTMEVIDVARLVRTTTDDHRDELAAAGLELVLELPLNPVWVRGDESRLIQVVGNLLNNARKFTNRGGRVTVRLALVDEAAVLTIADTGIGIAPTAIAGLFEAFHQVDADPARTKGGLGLGLAVVKGLVELHGGTVAVTSEGHGRGTTFTIRLPVTAAPPSRTPDSPPKPCLNACQRIAIIEDGVDTAESLQELLKLKGFDVEIAHTGPDGVKLVQRMRPDVVVCDLGLPGMTGFEVARVLRADPDTARATLICISGYGQEEDRRKAREAGFDAHLVKPADAEELVRMIARRKPA